MSERTRLVLLVGCAMFAAPFVFAAIPTVVEWSLGAFKPRQLFSATSPDGAYRIDGIVNLDFPVKDILDPSDTLRITLSNSRTGRHLDQLFIGLYEADDFKKPTIVWEPSGRVHVEDMEAKRHRLSAMLDIHQWARRE